ncbi:MAG: 2-hydroxyacyl-CoA dehydratase [Rhodospirillales bacterium]|nr:2-hydroxyacyl-CoA dehydratase [Rhodospirillales bacterium]
MNAAPASQAAGTLAGRRVFDTESGIVGRGAREGAKLFRDWFAELSQLAERGEGAAYCFVMGNMNEVLRTFDMPVVFPEINSLQTAVRRVSEEYLREAEDYGYSPDICGYVKVDFATQLLGGKHPMARIPKPMLAVTTNACNTYFKWVEIWERMHGTIVSVIDVPAERANHTRSPRGSEEYKNELAYIVGQVKDLIATCERLTGKKFDIDKFRMHLKYANEMSLAWRDILKLNERTPAAFNVLTDGLVYLGMSNGFRATETGAKFFKDLLEEMTFRSQNGIGPLMKVDGKDVEADQRFRLGFIGVPCYPIFRGFNEFFTDWGGTFVTSAYLTFASGGTGMGFEYDLNNPIESLAEGTLETVRDTIANLIFETPEIETRLAQYNLDGIVYHSVKSCRTISSGLADRRHHAAERLGISTLFLESDVVDPRSVAKAQMKNRADAFFEGMIARKQKKQTAPAIVGAAQ